MSSSKPKEPKDASDPVNEILKTTSKTISRQGKKFVPLKKKPQFKTEQGKAIWSKLLETRGLFQSCDEEDRKKIQKEMPKIAEELTALANGDNFASLDFLHDPPSQLRLDSYAKQMIDTVEERKDHFEEILRQLPVQAADFGTSTIMARFFIETMLGEIGCRRAGMILEIRQIGVPFPRPTSIAQCSNATERLQGEIVAYVRHDNEVKYPSKLSSLAKAYMAMQFHILQSSDTPKATISQYPYYNYLMKQEGHPADPRAIRGIRNRASLISKSVEGWERNGALATLLTKRWGRGALCLMTIHFDTGSYHTIKAVASFHKMFAEVIREICDVFPEIDPVLKKVCEQCDKDVVAPALESLSLDTTWESELLGPQYQ